MDWETRFCDLYLPDYAESIRDRTSKEDEDD